MSDFSALIEVATKAAQDGDPTPALALADFMSERDDERGDRLRARVKRFQGRAAFIHTKGRDLVTVEFITEDEWEATWREARAGLADYLFRLIGSPPGSVLPRKGLNYGGLPVHEPKG